MMTERRVACNLVWISLLATAVMMVAFRAEWGAFACGLSIGMSTGYALQKFQESDKKHCDKSPNPSPVSQVKISERVSQA